MMCHWMHQFMMMVHITQITSLDQAPGHTGLGPIVQKYKHYQTGWCKLLMSQSEWKRAGAMCEENMQFADLVNDCGKELITKGNMLIHLSSKISQIRDEFECSVSVQTGKKKHKHIIHLPLPEDPLEDIFIDNDIVITQCDPEE